MIKKPGVQRKFKPRMQKAVRDYLKAERMTLRKKDQEASFAEIKDAANEIHKRKKVKLAEATQQLLHDSVSTREMVEAQMAWQLILGSFVASIRFVISHDHLLHPFTFRQR